MSAIFYFINNHYPNLIIKTYERTFENGVKRGYWDIESCGRMNFHIDKTIGYISNSYINKEKKDIKKIIDLSFLDTFGIYCKYEKDEKDNFFTTQFIRSEIEKNGYLLETEESYDNSYFYGRFSVRSSSKKIKVTPYSVYFTLDILSKKMCVVVTDMNKISILFILHIFYVCKLKYSKYLNISENFIKFMIKFPKNTPIDTFLNNGFQYTENSDENFYIILKFLIDNYDNYNTIKIEWKYDEIFSHIKSLKEILYDPF